MIESIFFILILLLLVVATLKNTDAFPFSRYPMFSKLAEIEGIRVFRIAFEMRDEEITWWTSHFFRYPEVIGKSLANLAVKTPSDKKASAFIELEKQRLLREVLRLVELENGPNKDLAAVRIVKRTVNRNGNGLSAQDELIERIPIEILSKT